MPDEKVQRVMRRIGMWTCICGSDRLPENCHPDREPLKRNPANPAIIVAMLEWLTPRVDSVGLGNRDGEWTCAILRRYRSTHDVSKQTTLHGVIVDAINALPEN